MKNDRYKPVSMHDYTTKASIVLAGLYCIV